MIADARIQSCTGLLVWGVLWGGSLDVNEGFLVLQYQQRPKCWVVVSPSAHPLASKGGSRCVDACTLLRREEILCNCTSSARQRGAASHSRAVARFRREKMLMSHPSPACSSSCASAAPERPE